MKFGRRGFLKLLGATAATALIAPEVPKIATPAPVAPLYVPSERLDMGVPRRILTATEMPSSSVGFYGHAPVPITDMVPILLSHDEFSPPGWQQFGRQKVPAGTTLLVDRRTAERWIRNGVGTAAPTAPMDLQVASATRVAERQQRTWRDAMLDSHAESEYDLWDGSVPDHLAVAAPDPNARSRASKDQHWGRIIEQASERLRNAAPDPKMAWWDEPAIGEEMA